MPRLWTTVGWRRTMLALVFAGAGMTLTIMAAWLAWNVLNAPWPVSLAGARLHIIGGALYATLGLIALVLTGLSMTVALRQVSARFLGADFSASGGSNAERPGAALSGTSATTMEEQP